MVRLVQVVQVVKLHIVTLTYGRAVGKGFLSTGTTRSSRSSGEIAYRYSYLR